MPITVEEYLKINHELLCKLAYSYTKYNYIYNIEFNDLYQVGCLALIENYPKYDSTKGAISTFSYFIIKCAMLSYIYSNFILTHVPEDLIIQSKRYAKENEKFYLTNGRYMTLEEQEQLLDRLGTKKYKKINLAQELNKINLYNYRDKIYSIEDNVSNYDSSGTFFDSIKSVTIGDFLQADIDVEKEVITNIDIKRFLDSLTYLKPREKDAFMEVLGLYDNIPKTYKFLADRHHVSYQQVHKDYHSAIRKIKSNIKKD